MLIACTLFCALQPAMVQAQSTAQVSQFELTRSGDAVEIGATIKFDLPAVVQDALFKGLPVSFVEEAEVYRERWYWFDKRVAGAQRHLRLVFQPLLRRWRLSMGPGPASSTEPGVALAQTFDTLEEALAVIGRVTRWHIADVADLDTGVRHRVEFRFRLDVAQLPRPLQIGTLGESDWVLTASTSRQLQPESLK